MTCICIDMIDAVEIIIASRSEAALLDVRHRLVYTLSCPTSEMTWRCDSQENPLARAVLVEGGQPRVHDCQGQPYTKSTRYGKGSQGVSIVITQRSPEAPPARAFQNRLIIFTILWENMKS